MKSPFFVTHSDRVSLAKKRYFEEGVLPSGLVSDAVFQSWARCYRSHQQPTDRIEFQPVSVSRSQLAFQKNRVLHEAWLEELPALGAALGSASCSAILTEANGVLIGVSPSGNHNQSIIPVAHRVGINLSEEYVGTTAPSIVARTGKQACVLGSEHFYESVSTMYCTAAPIRNIQGELAGILDISSEGSSFHFDPSAVVGLYAASIENRLMIAQSHDYLIVKFQFISAILDTPMVGIIGFDLTGKLVWVNCVASNLLGVHVAQTERPLICVEDIFDCSFSQLASLSGRGLTSQRLSNGLHIFLKCELSAREYAMESLGLPFKVSDQYHDKQEVSHIPVEPVEAILENKNDPTSDSLKQADAHLIQKYLVELDGNVSQVAKRLKVSRGLIYRRLEQLNIDPALFKKNK
jgi:sigma-54 dependent transcriptional regulator, acetoin dehydrogenase operon transcriptional activator AcoR